MSLLWFIDTKLSDELPCYYRYITSIYLGFLENTSNRIYLNSNMGDVVTKCWCRVLFI